MARSPKYTPDAIRNIVKSNKLTSRNELRKLNSSAYAAALRQGLMDELFPPTKATKPAKAKAKPRVAGKREPKIVKVALPSIKVTNAKIDGDKGTVDMEMSVQRLSLDGAEKVLSFIKQVQAGA